MTSPQEAVSRALALVERMAKRKTGGFGGRVCNEFFNLDTEDYAEARAIAVLLPKPDPAVEACREIVRRSRLSVNEGSLAWDSLLAAYHAGAAHADTPLVEALREARVWVDANVAHVRDLSPEAAQPGEAMLAKIDAALCARASADQQSAQDDGGVA